MTTGANLAEVLAGEDRRAARTLAKGDVERVARQQAIEAANAAAERELLVAQGRQQLDEQRRAAGRTEKSEILAQRRTERAARRTERQARAAARREWVGARVDYVRHNAPAVYSTAIYLMAVGGAVYGQVTAATGRGWPLVIGVAIAAAIEGLALSMALTAHQLRLAGERALAPRALTWVCALAAGGINYLGHMATDPVGAVLLAALSVAGITVWEIRSGAKHRAALRALGLMPDPPARFGWRRWCRFPLATLAAWSYDVRERVGDQTAALFAAAEADRRRTDLARAARRAADRAARKGDAGEALSALRALAAAWAAGRESEPQSAAESGPGRADERAAGHAAARADDRAAGSAAERTIARADDRSNGRADDLSLARPGGGARVDITGGGEAPTTQVNGARHVPTYLSPGAAWSPPSPLAAAPAVPVPSPMPSPAPSPLPVPTAAPVPPPVRSPAGRRSATPTRRRTATRPSPDVSDLMDAGRAARERVAATGRTLTRDGLIAALRGDGHTVSSARASALLAALNAEATA